MGASDFAVNGNYSYDDMPAGQTDPTLAHPSSDHGPAYIIPVLRQGRRPNPAADRDGHAVEPAGMDEDN